jgi:Tfp pilus assembly protein PilF
MTIPLEFALARYKIALNALQESSLSEAQALKILSARDLLQLTLSSQTPVSTHIVTRVVKLDSQLNKQAYKLIEAINLADWRASSPNPTEDWWWHLDTKGQPHPWKQYDWLFKGLRVAAWTFSLVLLGDIIPRFVNGGLTVLGSWEIIVPSLLTLLSAGSELTEAGKKGWEKLINSIGLRQNHQQASLFGLITLLFILVIGFRASLPTLSEWRNQEGVNNYNQGKLGIAEEDYLRAVAFDPDNYDAHYNLGNLYEDLQKFDDAKKQYLIAIKGDFPQAYNNLARLHIEKKEYSQAAALLRQGIIKTREHNNLSPEDRYNLFKNLGWTRVEQKRFSDAQQPLEIAIKIASDRETASHIRNKGSAHCLLAQVIEEQKKLAIEEWQQCCQKANLTIPEEDTWSYLARTKLQEAQKTCK